MNMLLVLLLACLAMPTNAALLDRGGGLIYDDGLNITWLADANYAKTSGYDSDGRMTWAEAKAWALNLVYGGHDDWRLPSTGLLDTTCEIQTGATSFGSNCLGNEMGHLFYAELGGSAGSSVLTSIDPDLGLFTNIRDDVSINYWFGNDWFGNDKPGFHFYDGTLNYGGDQNDFYAWAVRNGDVAAIPEPSTYILMLAGLGMLGVAVRRNRKQVV